MNPEDLKSLKEFLAEEWRVPVEDVSDAEALAHHRRRRRMSLIGASIVLFAYVLCYSLSKRIYADALFLLVVLVIGVLSVLRPRTVLSPGRLKRTRELMAEQLGIGPEQLTDEQAACYDRLEWKSLLTRISFLCVVYALFSMLWRSFVVDVLALVIVLSVGVLSSSRFRPHTRR